MQRLASLSEIPPGTSVVIQYPGVAAPSPASSASRIEAEQGEGRASETLAEQALVDDRSGSSDERAGVRPVVFANRHAGLAKEAGR